jgi:iron complex outermembrane recepter protein
MFAMWPDVTIRQAGMFAEATTQVGRRQRVRYGVRVDQVNAKADDSDVQVNASMAPSKPDAAYTTYYGAAATDQDETNIGALLRYEFGLGRASRGFIGLSRSVRTADATERYINKWNSNASQRWVGNPILDPEQHHQFDMGFGHKTRRFDIDVSLFYDRVTDYILRDVARGDTYATTLTGASIYRNVDALLWGGEARAVWQMSKRLAMTAELSYTHATNISDDDRPIAQTPPLSGMMQLDYDRKRWSIGSRVRFADRQDRIDTLATSLEVGETAGWQAVDVYGSVRLPRGITLKAGVDNVFDHAYAEHASRADLFSTTAVRVNEQGMNAWLNVELAF